MRKVQKFAALLGILALCAATPLAAQIMVTGEGRVDAAPDIVRLSLGVTTQGRRAQDAVSANNAPMQALMAALSDAGIPQEDIQTSRFSVSPMWDRSNSNAGAAPRIAGYVVSNQLSVTLRDLLRLGEILDQLIAEGGNEFNGLSFDLEESSEALAEARRRAVADARARAALYAEAAGVTLGPLQSLSEAGAAGPGPMMMMEARAMSDGVPMAPGEISITAQVTLVYAIAE